MHYTIHNGVRRLRQLLGLVTEQCDRCERERERRRAIETSGPIDFPITQPIDAKLIVGLHPEQNVAFGGLITGWTSYRVHRDLRPSPRGFNREFFQYNTLGSATYQPRVEKKAHFPLPEAAVEEFSTETAKINV